MYTITLSRIFHFLRLVSKYCMFQQYLWKIKKKNNNNQNLCVWCPFSFIFCKIISASQTFFSFSQLLSLTWQTTVLDSAKEKTGLYCTCTAHIGTVYESYDHVWYCIMLCMVWRTKCHAWYCNTWCCILMSLMFYF